MACASIEIQAVNSEIAASPFPEVVKDIRPERLTMLQVAALGRIVPEERHVSERARELLQQFSVFRQEWSQLCGGWPR